MVYNLAPAVTEGRETLNTKDGEIKILRERLEKCNSEISRQKGEKLRQIQSDWQERNNKAERLQREVEALRNQTHFKDQELAELKNRIGKLEQQQTAHGPNPPNVKQVSPPRPGVKPDTHPTPAVPLPPTFDTFQFDVTPSQAAGTSREKCDILPAIPPASKKNIPKSRSNNFKLKLTNNISNLTGCEVVSRLLTVTHSSSPLLSLAALEVHDSTLSPNSDLQLALTGLQQLLTMGADGGGAWRLLGDCVRPELLHVLPLVRHKLRQVSHEATLGPVPEHRLEQLVACVRVLRVLAEASSLVRQRLLDVSEGGGGLLVPLLHLPFTSNTSTFHEETLALLTCLSDLTEDVSTLSSLSPLFTDNIFFHYFADKVSLKMTDAAVNLLRAASRNLDLLRIITSHSEPCLFSSLYAASLRVLKHADDDHRRMSHGIIHCLYVMVSEHPDAVTWLLPNTCPCSNLCVVSIIRMLWHWVCVDERGGGGGDATLVREGTALLHHFAKSADIDFNQKCHVVTREYACVVRACSKLTLSALACVPTVSAYEASAYQEMYDLDDLAASSSGEESFSESMQE